MKDKPDHLIEKFLEGRLLPGEEKELLSWLETPGGREFLKKEVQLRHLILGSLHKFDAETSYKKINSRVREKERPRVFRLRYLLKYAAVFMLLLAGSYYLYLRWAPGSEQLVIPDEKITLQLENGNIQTIIPGEDHQIKSRGNKAVIAQRGDTLYYEADNAISATHFNVLRVPYGKTFKLKLSDGTTVHMNAGTSLRFPVRFGEASREVFLDGEAYFRVAENRQIPFLVHTGKMDVKVTGTEFNVTAYQEDKEALVVLTKGRVALYGSQTAGMSPDPVALSPGEIGALEHHTGQFSTRGVNVNDYTAWMDGKTIFDNKAFKDVLKILERKYNVTIRNNYTELNEGRYKATFDNETIEQVLRTFTESRLFSYHIHNNIIIIDRPEESK
ncbi:FecR family protein [Sinomicrobium pectinilyticum]|uniref:FecR family protein n=1 Tax=Sinomicrobium pectinilyticum TaxID=1084421 RepID=A0A3N0CYY3_SINP1|nr:FecR family protein [Sinomicrobium pectinilyticum]RNL68622.1 FecR family protein [Sinomicrobium pectinilyticum]